MPFVLAVGASASKGHFVWWFIPVIVFVLIVVAITWYRNFGGGRRG